MKKKFLTTGLALLASLSIASGALAADTDTTKSNNVDITIKSGEFSLATPDIHSFGEVELKAEPQTYSTSFKDKFTVKDLRGTQAGWRVDVSATQFSDGTNKLPKGSLSLAPVENIQRVGTGQGGLPTKAMTSNKVIDNGAVAVIKADPGTGMGVFDFTFPSNALSVVVDATTAKVSGDTNSTKYTSTLTWNLVQAP